MRDTHVSLGCDLLVFDLDGTLVDSETDLANAVNASLGSLGRPHLPQEQIVGFIGDGAATLVNRSLEATGGNIPDVAKPALDHFLSHYRQHLLDTTRTYPGVLEALTAIHAVSPLLPMAVLTNKPVNPSRSICDGLGLSPYFFANYGGNSFPMKKPHPAGLLSIVAEAASLRKRPVALTRTVMVGDSHVDVETARAAGVLSLGCLYGLSPTSLRASQPDSLAETPADWLPQLRRLLTPSPLAPASGAVSYH